VSLEDPRTGLLSQYYFCPKFGLYEFTVIKPPASIPRSILFATSSNPQDRKGNGPDSADVSNKDTNMDGDISKQETGSRTSHEGFISKTAELLVATPVDLIFFMLPILAPGPKHTPAQKLFRSLDDILDSHDGVSKNLRDLLLHVGFRPTVESRMVAICDTVDAGETMFRLSDDKLVQELLSKAERMVINGLPPSLEERFVRRALELPILGVKAQCSSTSNISETNGVTPYGEPLRGGSESQSSGATTMIGSASIFSSISSPNAESGANESISLDSITQLLRIRTALSFMLSSYLPLHLARRVEEILTSVKSPKDFTALVSCLEYIAGLRAEALALRSVSDFSRKRYMADDEAPDARAEKKHKREGEEKKKKAGQSRAVRELKKVNTSGMKKMSDFFGKSAATSAA
jgi:hypothetical protein